MERGLWVHYHHWSRIVNQLLTENPRMAGRKKENFDRGRVEFKAPPKWIKRATDEAERAGFGSLSAFIRFAVTQYLDRAEGEHPKDRSKK